MRTARSKVWMYLALGCMISLFALQIPASAHTIPTKPASVPTTTVNLKRFDATFTSQMAIGATHEHYDADFWNDYKAVASAKQLMQKSLTFQNQQMMGWGTTDPEPSPGVYNWSSLDERVQLMRQTGAQMVITLCCAPGWMRPAPYQDDWNYLEFAPAPSHVQDFANLAAQVALRYPDVKYFQVWNELKGMLSTSPDATQSIIGKNRWDYERYTTLYNAVYDAIKAVRPDAQIGGPYVVMDSDGNRSEMSNPGPSYSWGTLDQRSLDVISYWLAHKHGADFITVDASSANKDGVWQTDPFTSAQKFVDVYNWIRSQPNGGATLPIWWAEWYAGAPANTSPNLAYYNALMASAAIYTAESGASMLLIWQPQGDSKGYSYPEGIWTDTSSWKGGQPTPYYYTSAAFNTFFKPGTVLYKPTVSSQNITAIASSVEMMLVNHLSTRQEVIVDGTEMLLNPYQVLITPTV